MEIKAVRPPRAPRALSRVAMAFPAAGFGPALAESQNSSSAGAGI